MKHNQLPVTQVRPKIGGRPLKSRLQRGRVVHTRVPAPARVCCLRPRGDCFSQWMQSEPNETAGGRRRRGRSAAPSVRPRPWQMKPLITDNDHVPKESCGSEEGRERGKAPAECRGPMTGYYKSTALFKFADKFGSEGDIHRTACLTKSNWQGPRKPST